MLPCVWHRGRRGVINFTVLPKWMVRDCLWFKITAWAECSPLLSATWCFAVVQLPASRIVGRQLRLSWSPRQVICSSLKCPGVLPWQPCWNVLLLPCKNSKTVIPSGAAFLKRQVRSHLSLMCLDIVQQLISARLWNVYCWCATILAFKKHLEEVKIAPRRLRQQRDKIHKREERRVCRQKMAVGRG